MAENADSDDSDSESDDDMADAKAVKDSNIWSVDMDDDEKASPDGHFCAIFDEAGCEESCKGDEGCIARCKTMGLICDAINDDSKDPKPEPLPESLDSAE